MASKDFFYSSRVSFYDTDAMGVMHHATYLRKFEDARVAWLRESGLSSFHRPHSDLVLAVTLAHCEFKKSCQFDDQIKVFIQVKRERLKLFIRYAMYDFEEKLLATGETQHVPMNSNLKLVKYPPEFLKTLESEKWTETWP